jgi:hypothetical protein
MGHTPVQLTTAKFLIAGASFTLASGLIGYFGWGRTLTSALLMGLFGAVGVIQMWLRWKYNFLWFGPGKAADNPKEGPFH